MALPRVECADAMIQLHLVVAPDALHRSTVHGEDGGVSLFEGQYHRARLHAWALLGHDELAPFEVLARLVQQNRDLYRKHVLAVQITVKTVVVVRRVLQQKGRRTDLARLVATIEEWRM